MVFTAGSASKPLERWGIINDKCCRNKNIIPTAKLLWTWCESECEEGTKQAREEERLWENRVWKMWKLKFKASQDDKLHLSGTLSIPSAQGCRHRGRFCSWDWHCPTAPKDSSLGTLEFIYLLALLPLNISFQPAAPDMIYFKLNFFL